MARIIKFIGVPEHFNRPWQLAIERGAFLDADIDVQWTVEKGGTGAMVQAVLSGVQDVAVALTEGIVSAIISNQATVPMRYCGEYVTSPLRWMVATGFDRPFTSVADVGRLALNENGSIKISVSRLGSGSHLMAYLLALREGWPADKLTFVVHRDLRTMRRGVVEGDADLFMWEWFMTKPFCDAAELKAIGWIDTPWHCFGFVARQEWLDDPAHRRLLQDTAAVLFQSARDFLLHEDASCEEITAHFGLSLEDAHSWMRTVSYAQSGVAFASDAEEDGVTTPTAATLVKSNEAGTADNYHLPTGSPLVVPKAMIAHCMEVLVQVGVLPRGPRKAGSGSISGYEVEDVVDGRVCTILDTPAPSAVLQLIKEAVAENMTPSSQEQEGDDGVVDGRAGWERLVPSVSIASLQLEAAAAAAAAHTDYAHHHGRQLRSPASKPRPTTPKAPGSSGRHHRASSTASSTGHAGSFEVSRPLTFNDAAGAAVEGGQVAMSAVEGDDGTGMGRTGDFISPSPNTTYTVSHAGYPYPPNTTVDDDDDDEDEEAGDEHELQATTSRGGAAGRGSFSAPSSRFRSSYPQPRLSRSSSTTADPGDMTARVDAYNSSGGSGGIGLDVRLPLPAPSSSVTSPARVVSSRYDRPVLLPGGIGGPPPRPNSKDIQVSDADKEDGAATAAPGADQQGELAARDIFTSHLPASFGAAHATVRARSSSVASTGSSVVGAGEGAFSGSGSLNTPPIWASPGGFGAGQPYSASASASSAAGGGAAGSWRMKSTDAVSESDTAAYSQWKGKKAAALAVIFGHLNAYGGLDENAGPGGHVHGEVIPFGLAPSRLSHSHGRDSTPNTATGDGQAQVPAQYQRGQYADNGNGGDGAPRKAWHVQGVLVDIG